MCWLVYAASLVLLLAFVAAYVIITDIQDRRAH